MKSFSVACLLWCVIGTAAQGRGQGGRTGQGPSNGNPKGRGQGGRKGGEKMPGDQSFDLAKIAREAKRDRKRLGIKGLGISPLGLTDEVELTVSNSFSGACRVVNDIDGTSTSCDTGRVILTSAADEPTLTVLSTDDSTGETRGFSTSKGHEGTKYFKVKQKKGGHLETVDDTDEAFFPPKWSCENEAAAAANDFHLHDENSQRRLVASGSGHSHLHRHHDIVDHEHHHHLHEDPGTMLVEESLKLRGSNLRLGQVHRRTEEYYTDSGSGTYSYEVGLYLEVDEELVTKTGGVMEMLDYLAELIAGINIMYEKEADTHLTIVEVVITGRYDSDTSTSAALATQRTALDGADWPNSEADLVHAILGRGLGGGIAYLGVLCNRNYGFGVSAGISGSYQISSPQAMVWDIVVVAHELGHNFDADHTHEMYGSSRIDSCGVDSDTSNNGFDPTCTGMESDAGTIMSYCHLCGGGINNIAATLGGHRTDESVWVNSALIQGDVSSDAYRIAQRMHSHVSSSTCVGSISSTPCSDAASCSDNLDVCTEAFCSSDGFCAYRPMECDDNNVCTMDTCSGTTGECVFTESMNCDDGNPCTTDSCHPTDGCVHVFRNDPGCTCGNGICDDDESFFDCPSDCSCEQDSTCTCEDDPVGWYDSDGPTFSCAWYASGSNCASWGNGYENFGKTANEACCVCGGGKYIQTNPCDPSPCENGGQCSSSGSSYTCNCVGTGFSGITCEIEDSTSPSAMPTPLSSDFPSAAPSSQPSESDECSPNPCFNGGSCTDDVNSYTCTCPSGYGGDRCETNIDDCSGNSCTNGATCVDGVDEYTCLCLAGFVGEWCEININDCDPDPCENGGISSDGVGSYSCLCPSGFEGDRCEIQLTSEPSVDPSSSLSKEPSLVLSLAPSLSPTGSPEVSPSASPSTPIPSASPKESPSARPSGSPEASPSSAPTNSPSQFNDCASDPCINGGTCVEFPGKGMFNCSCPLGYTGARCENNVNDCADNPCQNGNCTDGINSYMCQCDIGWEGDNCDENIDDCVDHNGSPKCLNNATCVDGIDSFACTCTEDFSGYHCEIEVTREPSPTPSTSPSLEPSASPTLLPSLMPSKSPTGAPTASPEASPSMTPSTAPSRTPTASPEASPSNIPSKMPTRAPTASPEASPSAGPSVTASGRPSMAPSSSPTQCNNNDDCSDEFFCNGEEICTNGVCEAGTPVSCDAGVACAVGICNEDSDTCDYQPYDSLCDQSAFCSPQTCDINIGCQTGTDPCSTGEKCDESNDVCVECMADTDCTSGESFEVASCNAGVCSYICSSELCPDDGDPCTDSVCHGDGYCHNVPNGSCAPIWNTIFFNDFETGWEDFNDGGSDVVRRADGIAHSGAYSIRIRDNSNGASAMHTNDFIVSQYQGLRVEFWYYPWGMENGENFLLEFSTDGGTSWTIAQSWARGTDFENKSWYEVSHDIDASAIDSVRIRFRCDASQNNDRIYIDDVTFRGSMINRNDCDPDPCLNSATCVDIGASFVCTCLPGFTGSTCETEITEAPSLSPSSSPSRVPSALPSSSPVSVSSPPPSARPSSMSDTPGPSSIPSRSPSSTPTRAPSSSPTQCRSDSDCTSGESFEVASCNAGVCSYICSSELCPDDGDPCTDSVCHGDGYCHNVPNGSCATWQTLRLYNFDDTAGSFAGSGWNDGGGDAAIRDNIKHSGLYSLRIRDNSGSSWASSEAIDVSSYKELRVNFFFHPRNMDGAEQFHLELSTNGGNFIRIRTWSVQNMVNRRWNEDTVDGIDVSSSDNIQLRFVCDGNTNRDQVYLDDIKVEGK